MKSLFCALALIALCFGCGGQVVRNANTHKNEVRFLDEICVDRLAKTQLEQAEDAAVMGDTELCIKLAKDALVGNIGVPYTLDMMLFAAELGDDPGKVPRIPDAEAWCKSKGAP